MTEESALIYESNVIQDSSKAKPTSPPSSEEAPSSAPTEIATSNCKILNTISLQQPIVEMHTDTTESMDITPEENATQTPKMNSRGRPRRAPAWHKDYQTPEYLNGMQFPKEEPLEEEDGVQRTVVPLSRINDHLQEMEVS